MAESLFAIYGFYLVCSESKKIDVPELKVCSVNAKHPSCNTEANFCSVCGAPTVVETVERELSFLHIEYDLANFIESVYPDASLSELQGLQQTFHYETGLSKGDILVCLEDQVFSVAIDSDGSSEMEIPLLSERTFAEVELFLQDKIALLKKYIYGKVELKFGTVAYWA